LSGMTATSIGPDSNRVMDALANLKWLVVMDPLPTTSSEFWRRPGADPKSIQTEVFMVPTTHWIEKDGSFVNSGRWSQWKDQVMPPQGQSRHDHWILADVFSRVKKLYQSQGGKFPDPIMALTLKYKDPLKPELDEKPWDPARPGITWNGSKWTGDVPDYPATMDPHDPNAWLPFIMNGEGVGRLFSNSMVDGPFPEHYEPVESPVQNPLHPANSASPVAFLYDKAAGRPNRFGGPKEFPYIATSYRLTEHEHYVTQHVPHLVQLQPKPFVEIPEELANEKSIKS